MVVTAIGATANRSFLVEEPVETRPSRLSTLIPVFYAIGNTMETVRRLEEWSWIVLKGSAKAVFNLGSSILFVANLSALWFYSSAVEQALFTGDERRLSHAFISLIRSVIGLLAQLMVWANAPVTIVLILAGVAAVTGYAQSLYMAQAFFQQVL